MRVTSSLDTTSTLLVTTLASARNFRLYQESSTRVFTQKGEQRTRKIVKNKDYLLKILLTKEHKPFLPQMVEQDVEVQA